MITRIKQLFQCHLESSIIILDDIEIKIINNIELENISLDDFIQSDYFNRLAGFSLAELVEELNKEDKIQ